MRAGVGAWFPSTDIRARRGEPDKATTKEDIPSKNNKSKHRAKEDQA